MGVRRAETITTSWFDMVDLMNSQRLRARRWRAGLDADSAPLRGRSPFSKMVTKAAAICAAVIDWFSRYQWAIQFKAPAIAKAVIFGSQGWTEPSWIPSRIRRRM